MYPIIPLPGGLYLPSYFLVITLGYLIGLFLLYNRTLKYEQSMHTAMDSAILMMVGGFIGSRLFHVLFELPDYYWDRPMDILKIWQGGFVFYGGVLGAVLPVLILMKLRQEPMYEWMRIFAPIAPIVYAIGRFATLLSGSGYGKPTSLPWGVTYPLGVEAPAGIALHPTQMYAVLWEMMVIGVVYFVQGRIRLFNRHILPGFAFGLMVSLHGIGRAAIEQLRDDFRGELILGLTISTWISVVIVALGVGISISRIEPRFGKQEN